MVYFDKIKEGKLASIYEREKDEEEILSAIINMLKTFFVELTEEYLKGQQSHGGSTACIAFVVHETDGDANGRFPQ